MQGHVDYVIQTHGGALGVSELDEGNSLVGPNSHLRIAQEYDADINAGQNQALGISYAHLDGTEADLRLKYSIEEDIALLCTAEAIALSMMLPKLTGSPIENAIEQLEAGYPPTQLRVQHVVYSSIAAARGKGFLMDKDFGFMDEINANWSKAFRILWGDSHGRRIAEANWISEKRLTELSGVVSRLWQRYIPLHANYSYRLKPT